MPLKLKLNKNKLKPVKEIVQDFDLLIPLVAGLYDWDIEFLGDTETLDASLERTARDDVDTDDEEEFDKETLKLQSDLLNKYEDWYDMFINDEDMVWDKDRPIESAKSVMRVWDKVGMDSQLLKSMLLNLWNARINDEIGSSKEDTFRGGEIEALALENWDDLDEKIDDLNALEVVEFEYDGVDYLLDPKTNELYNPDNNEKVGVWDGEKVILGEGFDILDEDDDVEPDDMLIPYDFEKEGLFEGVDFYLQPSSNEIYIQGGESEFVLVGLLEKDGENFFTKSYGGDIKKINEPEYPYKEIYVEVIPLEDEGIEIYLNNENNKLYDEDYNYVGIVDDDDDVGDFYEKEKNKK